MANLLEELRDFNPIEYFFGHWTPLQSSNLAAYRYNEGEKKLQVRFTSGRIYEYADVPKDVAEGLSTASSPGKYFNAEIKNSFHAEHR